MVSTEVVDAVSMNEDAVSEGKFSLFHRLAAIAGFLDDARERTKASKRDYVAIKRFDPNALSLTTAQIAALTHVAKRAKLDYERWTSDEWLRWAFIAYGIALAGHDKGDDKGVGRRMADAGVSEARLTRLLDARGKAFFQILPRVLRLMSSRNVKPNWLELAVLVLNENGAASEDTRVSIASQFFGAKAKEDSDD
jgi:CRISPR system Cascade subunit CasB